MKVTADSSRIYECMVAEFGIEKNRYFNVVWPDGQPTENNPYIIDSDCNFIDSMGIIYPLALLVNSNIEYTQNFLKRHFEVHYGTVEKDGERQIYGIFSMFFPEEMPLNRVDSILKSSVCWKIPEDKRDSMWLEKYEKPEMIKLRD